jgi:hypothetical protein
MMNVGKTNFDQIQLDKETAIASPNASDLATAITLLNEIKAKLNTIFKG